MVASQTRLTFLALALVVLSVALFGCTQSNYAPAGTASPVPTATLAAGYDAADGSITQADPSGQDANANDLMLGDVDDSNFS